MEPKTETRLLKFTFVTLSIYLLYAFCSANSQHFTAVATGKAFSSLNGTWSARTLTTDDGTNYKIGFDFYYLDYSYENVKVGRYWSCGEGRQTLGSGVPVESGNKILLTDPQNPETVTGELIKLADNRLAFHTRIDDEQLGGQGVTLYFEHD